MAGLQKAFFITVLPSDPAKIMLGRHRRSAFFEPFDFVLLGTDLVVFVTNGINFKYRLYLMKYEYLMNPVDILLKRIKNLLRNS